MERIWSTWLSALLLTLLFLIVLYLQDTSNLWAWTGYGLLWGFAGMTEPIVLSVLPCLSLWACYRLFRREKRWLLPSVVSALAFIVVVSPWFIRNYRVFHRFIPFRDTMGLEWAIGNSGHNFHWRPSEVGPWHNDADWAEFKRFGELNYMAQKQSQAFSFIEGHPSWFVVQTVRLIGYIWTGFWSFDPRYLAEEPLDPLNVAFCTILTTLTLFGLWCAFRKDSVIAVPFALVLLFFPLLYYVTHPEVYYRRQIDPQFVVLAVYAVAARVRKAETAAIEGIPFRQPLPETTLEASEF